MTFAGGSGGKRRRLRDHERDSLDLYPYKYIQRLDALRRQMGKYPHPDKPKTAGSGLSRIICRAFLIWLQIERAQ